ncbi:MAG: D-2-hydroxyacid dehydrogenase [Spirochaetia bacterium]|nr:D-2-hydroxyacid dehydrogenase [Spirochaetia bacterium]
MNKIKTLVLITLTDTEKKHFTQFNDRLDISFKDIKEVPIMREDIEDAEIIIGYPPKKFLETAKNLKWLQVISSGVDKYMRNGILPKNTIITNARGSYGEAQSEFMFSMLIALIKKLHIYRDNQKQSKWQSEGDVMMLRGSTALVIGLGDIGGEFAKLLKAFGVYVIGVRRDATKPSQGADEIHSFTKLDSLIPRADIIAMVIPASPETENLMNSKRISMMKKGAVLVNTGRGVTVDNEALCDAVESGHLAGAAIDVFNIEPIPMEHRIWEIENLLITPHVAGLDYMAHNWSHTLTLILENLQLYCEGKELRNKVDKSLYEFS